MGLASPAPLLGHILPRRSDVTDYEMVVALGGCVVAFAILGAIVAWITQPR